MSHSEPPWDQYARQMFTLKIGWAVWDGHPANADEEIRVGSVVYPLDGRLTPLFNVLEEENVQGSSSQDVPDPFQPLNVANLNIRDHDLINHSPLSTDSIAWESVGGDLQGGSMDGLISAGVGYKVTYRSNSGAFLFLNPPGIKRAITAKRRIVTYMKQNFDHWMRFANDSKGLGLTQDELWFVAATIKTNRWMNATLSGEFRDKEGFVNCELAGALKVNLSMRVGGNLLIGPARNFGPREPTEDVPVPTTPDPARIAWAQDQLARRSQCIFVNYYRMKKRLLWRARPIAAAAGPHQLPPGENDDDGHPGSPGSASSDDIEVEEMSPPTPPFDPVGVLLDYILENSEADVAIGSDRDIISMFKDQPIPHDLKAGIEAIRPTIDVDEDGVGTVVVDLELFNEPRMDAHTTGASDDVVQPPSSDPATQPSGQNMEIPQAESSGVLQAADADEALTGEQAAQRREMKQPEAAIEAHTGSVISIAVSPDNKWIASGSDDATIILWDAEHRVIARKLESHRDIVWQVTFSPDSQRLASASGDGRIMIWAVHDAAVDGPLATLEGHTDTIHTAVWSPDGAKIASGSDDMTVRVWDAVQYGEIAVLEGHNAMIAFTLFSPDGTMLASGGADYNCRIWDASSLTLRYNLQGHKGMVWAASFDHECRRIATASDDGSVRIWSTTTGEELVILHEHHGPVWTVAFSSDGKQIMSASSDSTIKVCDSFSGEKILSLDGHDSMVNSAQFSPDGKYIASASSDNTLRLWRTSDGTCVRTFNEHDDKVTQAVFSPNGQLLSSGSDDGTVLIRVLSDWVQE